MAGIQQTVVIRPFNQTDYAPMVELWNLLNPDWPRTLEWEEDDRKAEERFRSTRFVADLEGQRVGIVDFATNPGSYHPQKFSFELYVHPDQQGHGMGKALYQKMLETLQPLEPLSLRVSVRENQTRAVKFFQDLGFVETKRDWVSMLEVAKAHLEAFTDLEMGNVRIQTFAELSAADPQANAKLHELFSDIRIDTPRSEPVTPISLEFFEANMLDSSDYHPEAFFIALDDDHWVGMSSLYHIGDSTSALDHWFTGVRRAYRGRKIALALKLRTIEYAQTHGFQTIRTDNDSLNAPMLAINEKLGFVRGAAQLSMRKILRDEP